MADLIATVVYYTVTFIALYLAILLMLLYFKYEKKLKEKTKPKNWFPRISVVIPAYNEERNIERCIRSLLTSGYPKNKLEIIAIDDGSKDNTYAIANKMAKESKNVKAFTKQNSGKAASVNFGITKATGEIIATLDADSYIMPDTIEKLLPLFDADNVAAVTAAVRIKGSKKWIEDFQRLEYLIIIFTRRLLSFVDAVPVTPGPFSMFRSWVFKRLGNFDETNIVEDHEMALRIQSAHYKIRSSIDADVFTEAKNNMADLLKQRVRWHRGGLHNTFKYNWMMSPKYGDFGVLVMPLMIVSVVTLFAVLAINIIELANNFFLSQRLGWDVFYLSLSPLTVLSIFIALISAFWAYSAISTFKEETKNPIMIFIYLLFYWYLMIAYNVLTFAKEIKKESFSW